jgi:N-acetylglucosamine-6-phosphate deacetylase
LKKNKILKIVPEEDVGPDCEVILLHKGLICPGFVDIQVNGGGGYLLNEAPSLQILEKICDTHAKLGTTSLFPTLISDVPSVTKAAQNCAVEAF